MLLVWPPEIEPVQYWYVYRQVGQCKDPKSITPTRKPAMDYFNFNHPYADQLEANFFIPWTGAAEFAQIRQNKRFAEEMKEDNGIDAFLNGEITSEELLYSRNAMRPIERAKYELSQARIQM